MVSGALRLIGPEEARRSWDGWLSSFEDAHVKQSFGWGEMKRAAGWEPLRAGLFAGQEPLALAQCALKRPAPGMLLAWANGGPAWRRGAGSGPSALRALLEGLQAELLRLSRRPYLRLNLMSPQDPGLEAALRGLGFERPGASLWPGLTVVVDLSPPLEELRAGLDKKWRNQLKSAESGDPRFESGPGLAGRYRALHAAMCARKGLARERLAPGELESMLGHLGGGAELLLASKDGKDGAGMCLWHFGSGSFVGLSAADDWGREHYLSNALYWEAMRRCKARGSRFLDTCGVDPRSGSGVYHFKRGLGGRLVQTTAEREWSPSSWTRRAASWAIRLKYGKA